MPFVPDAQQPGTPRFVPDTPATQAPAAQGAVAAFIDALGKAAAIPGKPEANLAALANHITSFLPGQQSYEQGTAQQAATAKANPSADMLGAAAGHIGEGALAAATAAPLLGAGAGAALGAGRAASALTGAATGAVGGAASAPETPGTGAVIGTVTGGAGGALSRGVATGGDEAATALGLRKVNTLGKALAGSTTGPALTAQNAAAGTAAIGREAGLAADTVPSYDALTAARAAPGQVMKNAAASLPEGQLDAQAQAKLAQAGVPQGGTRTPDINTLAQINDERNRLMLATTGEQHAANLASLRQEGFAGIGSDTAAERNLASAKLDMANAVQDHIERNLPANGPVSASDFLDARKALAKNYTAVEALKGNSFDLQKLARIQRASPTLLDGDMETVANFANNNPEITGHPSQLQSPNLLGDIKNVSLAHPASYVQPVTGMFGRALLRGGTSTPSVLKGLGSDFEPLANNASGESAASQEAINRGSRNVMQVDPDGNGSPVMSGVNQVDARAPQGHLLVDGDTGEILDRGGMNQRGAEGLRNRWQATRSGGLGSQFTP